MNRLIPEYASAKKYTAIAQATLLSKRRDLVLHMQPGMTEAELYRALSSFGTVQEDGKIDSSGETPSFSVLSEKLRAQLDSDLVVALPTVFFPLHDQWSTEMQDTIVTRGLNYLKYIRLLPLEAGNSSEKRLQSAAQACGILCFRNCFQLPSDLNDRTIPDLFKELTIMELGRARDVDVMHP